jgi:hypothetical protein
MLKLTLTTDESGPALSAHLSLIAQTLGVTVEAVGIDGYVVASTVIVPVPASEVPAPSFQVPTPIFTPPIPDPHPVFEREVQPTPVTETTDAPAVTE